MPIHFQLQNGITKFRQIYKLTLRNWNCTNALPSDGTIKIRNSKSPYQYAFTLINMLTNYMFAIPIKDISRKTLVHEYIYKVYLPFRSPRNSCQITGPALSMNTGKFWPKHYTSNTSSLAPEIPE